MTLQPAKSFFVLGESHKSGVLIRCDDREIAEHELALMRWSDCRRIARTSRAALESDMKPWFTPGLPVSTRDSRFNAGGGVGCASLALETDQSLTSG